MSKIKYPILIINFKTYIEATGKRGLELARIAEKVSKELNVCIAVAPIVTDLRLVSENVEIPVLAQSADPVNPGAHTGHVTLEAIKECGAVGIILNHSEKPLRINDIAWIVEKAKSLNMYVLTCAPTPETSLSVASLNPDAVAVEPPELIGTGRAVSKEKPDVIVKTVELIKKHVPEVHVICGAGIEAREDVVKAIELGTEGVLVASAIVKARDWYGKIRELAEGLLK